MAGFDFFTAEKMVTLRRDGFPGKWRDVGRRSFAV